MNYGKDAGLRPRNGHTLIVAIVARISGGPRQKEVSLEDQVDHGKEEIGALYKGAAEYEIIATKGKGEWLDRPELAEIEAILRTRRLDVLFVEDLGRLVRAYANTSSITWPCTSVSRRFVPLCRNVSFSWSMPNRCSTVACKS